MADASNNSVMSSEFEAFLYAGLGEQKNGMTVSIFSALSRLDIDPWREAKRLSDLPKDRAIQALRGTIDRLTDLQDAALDAAGTAARLIGLLPNHSGRARQNTEADAPIQPRRRAQLSVQSYLLDKASALPMSVWLLIGAVVIGLFYFAWSGENASRPASSTSAPSSYDNPVREQQPRR